MGAISLLTRHVPRRYLEAVGPVALRLYAATHRGDAVKCPVCTRTFSKFMAYGHVHVRANALCPNCLALERHRALWLYLQQRTDFLETPLKVLHVAPERCFNTRFAAIHGKGYVTADLESPSAQVHVDVQSIPFPDESFNVVICNHVLEHVEDDRKAMRELHRVLRRGGWAVLLSPIDRSRPVTYEDTRATTAAERERAFGQRDHRRIYGRDYPDRLAQAGFEVSEDDFVRTLPTRDISRYALDTDEIIFVCRK